MFILRANYLTGSYNQQLLAFGSRPHKKTSAWLRSLNEIENSTFEAGQVPTSSAVCGIGRPEVCCVMVVQMQTEQIQTRDVTVADCVFVYFYSRPHLKYTDLFPTVCISPPLSFFQSAHLCNWQPPTPLPSTLLLLSPRVWTSCQDTTAKRNSGSSLACSLTLPSDCNRSEALASTKQRSVLKPLFIMWRGRPPSHAFTAGDVGCQQVALCQIKRCVSL